MVATLVLLGTTLDAAGLLDENSRRRGLGDKAEGTVGIHSDDHGDHIADVVLGALIEFLGERHDVDAVLTQSRTNRGRRGRLAGGDLKLDIASYLLRHFNCTSIICGKLAGIAAKAAAPSHGHTHVRPIKTACSGSYQMFVQIFFTWFNSTSAGVSRPNMDTVTFTRFLSMSITLTIPIMPFRAPARIST